MAWFNQITEIWPKQGIPMYHYGIASAMGYALSMFSETLRDRKIVTLEQARDRHACAPRRRASAPRARRRPRHLSAD